MHPRRYFNKLTYKTHDSFLEYEDKTVCFVLHKYLQPYGIWLPYYLLCCFNKHFNLDRFFLVV